MVRKSFFLSILCLCMVFASSCKQETVTEEQIQSRVDQEVEAAKTEVSEMYEAKIDSILKAHDVSMKQQKNSLAPRPKSSGNSSKPKVTTSSSTGAKDPNSRTGTKEAIKNAPRKDPNKRTGTKRP